MNIEIRSIEELAQLIRRRRSTKSKPRTGLPMQQRKLDQLRDLLVRNWKFLVQTGVTILGILRRERMAGCFLRPLVLRLRLDFLSARGCE